MANLGRDQMILGYPWFQKFNPHFDWNMHTLKGNIVEINTAGYRTKLATPLQAATLTEADKRKTGSRYKHKSQKHTISTGKCSVNGHLIATHPNGRKTKEGAPDRIDCKIYRQTEEELEATCKFIEESLAKGYIVDSKSPYAAALFY